MKPVVSHLRRCQYEFHTLYSLLDMISFLADGLFDPLEWLAACIGVAEDKIPQTGDGARLTREDCEWIERQLSRLKPVCEKLGLQASQNNIYHLTMLVAKWMELPMVLVVAASFKQLRGTIQSEVNKLQFAFIPAGKVQFFEKHDLFGERVSAAFPSAQPEIQDAGNCLAADLHTAAVFHLMRAVEHGLRALARRFKVRLGQPLEYACWEHVIRAAEKKDQQPAGKTEGQEKGCRIRVTAAFRWNVII